MAAPLPEDDQHIIGASGLMAQSFAGLCPRCKETSMFTGWIAFHNRCPACSFDYSAYNVGDGPAAFLTLIIGACVSAMALALEFTLYPPFWLHMLIWPIVVIAMVVYLLRVSKAALLIAEVRKAFSEKTVAPNKPEDKD